MFKEIKFNNFKIKLEKRGIYLIEEMGDEIFEEGLEVAYPLSK